MNPMQMRLTPWQMRYLKALRQSGKPNLTCMVTRHIGKRLVSLNATVEFDEIEHETDEAVKFSIEERSVWLPKSEIEFDIDERTIELPEWLAMDKGLI